MNQKKIISKIENSIIYGLIFLMPLFIIPSFQNPYILSKNTLLVVAVCLLLVVKVFKILIDKKFTVSSTKLDIPIIFVVAGYIASFFISKAPLADALFIPGVLTQYVFLGLLFVLISQSEANKKHIKLSLLLSAIVFSIIQVFAITKIMGKFSFLPAFAKDPTFNPMGALVPSLSFLAAVLPIAVGMVIKEKDYIKKFFFSVAALFIVFGVSASFYNLLSDKNIKVVLPPVSSSWNIAIETLKQKPFVGIGPGNYTIAFNKFRSVSSNTGDLWNVKFSYGRDLFLTVLTEAGLIAFAGIVLLILNLLRNFKKYVKEDGELYISICILILHNILFPPFIAITFMMFILPLFVVDRKPHEVSLAANGKLSLIPSVLISLPILAISLVSLYFYTDFFRGELEFNKAAAKLTNSDIVGAYDSVKKAVEISPNVDRYHLSFSQISYAVAIALAKKENQTDQDKQTAVSLIAQSINEAKRAVTLNKDKSDNWAGLARIYQSIIPFAKGADAFAIQTQSRAVMLDPVNPLPRLTLGGIYYSLKRYDEATSAYELAVIAKPDYANAHYNLAYGLKEKKDYKNAVAQMELVLSLVKPDSPDYKLAQKELESLKAQRDTQQAATENLNPPQELEKPVITPPVELPQSANPPQE